MRSPHALTVLSCGAILLCDLNRSAAQALTPFVSFADPFKTFEVAIGPAIEVNEVMHEQPIVNTWPPRPNQQHLMKAHQKIFQISKRLGFKTASKLLEIIRDVVIYIDLMMRYSVLALTLLGLVGCQQDLRLCAPTFHVPTVKQKPILAMIPIFDQTKHRQPWNIAGQLTTGVLRHLSLKDQLYMVDQEKLAQIFTELQNTGDLFGTDVQWIKKKFRSEEFVAFVELVKNEETLLNFHNDIPDADCPAELYLSARIRIFDLRNPVPKLVLSEVVNHSENIPKEFNRINRTLTTPEQENFQITPHGIAHESFAREIAERIEDYVLLAQTR